MPPGCVSISCAHARAPEFYAESVYPGYENNFLGVKCGSLTALNGNFCPGKKYPMGYAVPKNLKGNFFLKTNDKSLYGLNAPKNFSVICNDGKPLIDSKKQNGSNSSPENRNATSKNDGNGQKIVPNRFNESSNVQLSSDPISIKKPVSNEN